MSVCIFSLNVSAEETVYTDGDYTYTVENGKATLTKLSDNVSGDVIIPETIGGYPVDRIGSGLFESSLYEPHNITSVTVPDGVTEIGAAAFEKVWCEAVLLRTSARSVPPPCRPRI